jgi:DNA invertase Pin-like site-specific DNA recombinase
MSSELLHKVTPEHIGRDAYLYVRQSSLRQVFENTESTKRQYALRERAVALGWPIERVHVIDNDLGRSGAEAKHRDGFQHLVSEVALGRAGIILGLEVSRLARNNADWHRLLELAALTHTLILDEDGIYDPAHFNDRLLLGLKGTMSEAELHVLKARLQGGIRNKARRGELEVPLPIGFLYAPDRSVVLDADLQIRTAIELLFSTFRQVQSASMVVRRFQHEEWRFPRRVRRGIGKGDVLWGPLDVSRVLQILHNPRYAGAFVYGRSRTSFNAQLKSTQLKLPREQWHTLIRDAHPGYIEWAEYEHNQVRLKSNAAGFASSERGGVPREGVALLQGRVVCGRCGARMRARYQVVAGRPAPYYQCTEALVRRAGKLCQSVRGQAIDARISDLLLETVAPTALEIALAVHEEIAARIDQAETVRRTELERARYEAELARRRYLKVDPDNRLVADALEADWNALLRRLDTLQCEHEQQRKADAHLLDDEARDRILALARDFPRVWNDPRTSPLERKRMVALLIEDVTLLVAAKVTVNVRWRGGQTTTFSVERPKPIALIRKTRPEVVAAIDELLDTCTDAEVAQQLNEMGYCNWKQQPFTDKKVRGVRYAYGLKSRYERLRSRGLLTGVEMALQLGVSTVTVHQWGRSGLLARELYGRASRCLYLPPGNVIVEKGRGGRHPKSPKLITVPLSTQETV